MPPKYDKKLAEQEALQQPWFSPIDLVTALFTGGTSFLRGAVTKGATEALGTLATKGASKMGVANKALGAAWKLTKKGWPFLLGFAIGGGSKKKEEESALPTPTQTPALTQEQFQRFVDQINSVLAGEIPTNKYSRQAVQMATSALPSLQNLYAPLIGRGKRLSKGLTQLAGAIPLVATQGPSYYDTALLDTLGSQIQRLLAQAQPVDTSFGSLLRAKYARRALQTALPTYASLVSAGRTSVTPSAVVPNLMTAAANLQMQPQLAMLQAIPQLMTGAQTTLRTVGAGQQAKAAMLLNTLLGGQSRMDVATLNALSRLGALDPAIKDLILQQYAQ